MSIYPKAKEVVLDFKRKNSVSRYNILFIAKSLPNDCKTQSIVDMIDYLAEQHVGTIILCGKKQEKYLLKKNVFYIHSIFLKLSFIGIIPLLFKIKKICRSCDVDVICCHDITLIPLMLLCSKVAKVKNFFFAFNIFDIGNRAKYFCSKIIEKCSKIFAFSGYVSDFILNNYNINFDKLYEFPMAVNNSRFSNEIGKDRIIDTLQEIDINIGDKEILTCLCDFANLEECETIISIIKRVHQNHQNFVCVLTGNFNGTKKQRKYLIQQIRKENLSLCVRIVDTIQDREALYAISYAVLCFRSEDIFDNVVCEAGIAKKPVIAFNFGEYKCSIINGKTGFLTKKNNTLDTAKAILKILNLNQEEYEEMCKNAFTYSSSYFPNEKVFKNIDEIFFNAVQEKDKNFLEKKKIAYK